MKSVLRKILQLCVVLGVFVGLFGLDHQTYAAGSNTIFTEPPTLEVIAGKTFQIQVKVQASQPVNAVSAVINYPLSRVRLVSISDDGSPFTVKVEAKDVNGVVTITKGSTVPLTGNLLLATLTLDANTLGTTVISPLSSSSLVSSDTNKNILSGVSSSSIQIVAVPTVANSIPTVFIPTNTPTLKPVSPTPVPQSRPFSNWFKKFFSRFRK